MDSTLVTFYSFCLYQKLGNVIFEQLLPAGNGIKELC